MVNNGGVAPIVMSIMSTGEGMNPNDKVHDFSCKTLNDFLFHWLLRCIFLRSDVFQCIWPDTARDITAVVDALELMRHHCSQD